MVQNAQTIMNTATGFQAVTQGANGLAATAGQVNRFAAAQLAPEWMQPGGSLPGVSMPIEQAAVLSTKGKFHQMFQLPANPTAEQIDAAVGKMVKDYFIANEAAIRRRYFDSKDAVILKGFSTISDCMERIVDSSLDLSEEFSQTLRPLFWDSLQRHVVAHIMKWDQTPAGWMPGGIKAHLETLFAAVYRSRILGFTVG